MSIDVKKINCTYVGHDMRAELQDIYLYNCYSKEKVFGVISLVIMFLPGFMLAFLIGFSLRKSSQNMWIFIMISPILCVTFPILLFLVKVSVIFSNLIFEKYDLYSFHLHFEKLFLFLMR